VNWDSRTGRLVERLAIVVASLVFSIGAIALLSGYFAGKDQAGITGTATGPGTTFRDLGDAALPPGRLQPPYDSTPPTSGPHVPEAVTHDESVLNDYQLLTALAQGDVVITYGTKAPPAGLTALARSIAGPFTPDLAATGQAVILAREPGTTQLIGLAWTHMVTVGSPSDPRLAAFAKFWLGKGAPANSLPVS
jgi:hypothetical protein